jgi:hypothetical protein
MAQHKWHKEIKAWADGAEIEYKFHTVKEWRDIDEPQWDVDGYEYRIKPQPKEDVGEKLSKQIKSMLNQIEEFISKNENTKLQPKEPQYLYVYKDYGELCLLEDKIAKPAKGITYIGKIKLEDEDV